LPIGIWPDVGTAADPRPPAAGARVPPNVTAPVVAVFGVRPVLPPLNDATVLLVVARVPLVGSVIDVVPVAVIVTGKAPACVTLAAVDSVLPLASDSVPVVVLINRPLMLVAVATPRTGVVSVGDVARTMLPEPVVALPSAVTVPLVGSVSEVAAVAVSVVENAPAVAKVLPLASDSVPVVVLIVRPLTLVAVATPRTGVVSVGDVARTMLPEPVVALPSAVTVPLVGSVSEVAAVAVSVVENAPAVAKVLPLASDSVPVVVLIDRPLMLVAVATPRTGVVSVGDVARTMLPEPVVALPSAVTVPLVGSVIDVVPVAVIVTGKAPACVTLAAVDSVLALAIDSVPVVVLIDRPLMLVAVATPRTGVVSVGDVARTTAPLPVVVAEDAAVSCPCAFTVSDARV